MHEKILYHINHGMLYFSGLEPVEPFIAWTPLHIEENRERYLEEYKKRLYNISDIPSIPYHPSSHYDENHQLIRFPLSKYPHKFEQAISLGKIKRNKPGIGTGSSLIVLP
ncbi:hypothetical protein [Bacillus thuringiensis]|uniref:hypothetical protein n=1 Tax=Bacillus thuringiensis TaxID=1428 RepID=UPI0021C02C85|nr:hypothetical protein [Bacillus thuringiensis]